MTKSSLSIVFFRVSITHGKNRISNESNFIDEDLYRNALLGDPRKSQIHSAHLAVCTLMFFVFRVLREAFLKHAFEILLSLALSSLANTFMLFYKCLRSHRSPRLHSTCRLFFSKGDSNANRSRLKPNDPHDSCLYNSVGIFRFQICIGAALLEQHSDHMLLPTHEQHGPSGLIIDYHQGSDSMGSSRGTFSNVFWQRVSIFEDGARLTMSDGLFCTSPLSLGAHLRCHHLAASGI